MMGTFFLLDFSWALMAVSNAKKTHGVCGCVFFVGTSSGKMGDIRKIHVQSLGFVSPIKSGHTRDIQVEVGI